MTVIIAFYCTDGVVIAADSMLTPSVGGLRVGHHHGKKISILSGQQIFAFAGDIGQSARFEYTASLNARLISEVDPLSYVIALTQAQIEQFKATGIVNSIDTNPVLAFPKNGQHFCCVFEGPLQPRLLTTDHYYVALGGGKLSADPFLRFLTDTFCLKGRHPTVGEAAFLAVWAVQHVIDVNSGGVDGPIRVAVLEGGVARNLSEDEISAHLQAVDSAAEALREWRDSMQSGAAAEDAPEQPEAPTQS